MVFVFHSIEAAVATFAQARPPGIYKGDYLKELFRRYGDIEEAPPPPLLPDWCFEDDEDEDDDEDGKKESEPGSRYSIRVCVGCTMGHFFWCERAVQPFPCPCSR